MKITQPGTYQVKTKSGSVYSVEVIEINGELGWYGEATFSFVKVDDWVGVEVLCRTDQYKSG